MRFVIKKPRAVLLTRRKLHPRMNCNKLRFSPDDDRIVSHDAPRFMLYYHCVRDILWSLLFSTRVMNIVVLDLYGFQTCFGSAASVFENIELADIYCALKKNFSVALKGYMCFTDLWRTTCALGRNYKHKVWYSATERFTRRTETMTDLKSDSTKTAATLWR